MSLTDVQILTHWFNHVPHSNINPDRAVEFARACIAEATAWRPIETAPRDGTPILIHRGGIKKNRRTIAIGRWRSGWARWQTIPSGYWWDDVTHWQPLPGPPAEQQPRENA